MGLLFFFALINISKDLMLARDLCIPMQGRGYEMTVLAAGVFHPPAFSLIDMQEALEQDL